MANVLQCNVAVQREKYNILQCLESDQLRKIIVQDYKNAKVHVLPMAQLTHQVRNVSDSHLVHYALNIFLRCIVQL